MMAQREGHLLIDHRASPGLTEEQARFCGYDPMLTREGKVFEGAVLTCVHCKNSVLKSPIRQRPRHSCMKCGNKYVCDFCHANMQEPDYTHLPFEKIADLTQDFAAKGILLNTTQKLVAAANKTLK